MSESTRWALPLLTVAQAQKEITHNEAVLAIDRLLHLAAKSRSTSVPPEQCIPGETFIVGSDPSGAWAGSAGMLASFDGTGWTMIEPRTGCLAWIVDEAKFAVFDGMLWSTDHAPASGLGAGGYTPTVTSNSLVAVPQGGSVIDSECRQALTALLVELGSQGIISPKV